MSDLAAVRWLAAADLSAPWNPPPTCVITRYLPIPIPGEATPEHVRRSKARRQSQTAQTANLRLPVIKQRSVGRSVNFLFIVRNNSRT
jgi:hypothetical protein